MKDGTTRSSARCPRTLLLKGTEKTARRRETRALPAARRARGAGRRRAAAGGKSPSRSLRPAPPTDDTNAAVAPPPTPDADRATGVDDAGGAGPAVGGHPELRLQVSTSTR